MAVEDGKKGADGENFQVLLAQWFERNEGPRVQQFIVEKGDGIKFDLPPPLNPYQQLQRRLQTQLRTADAASAEHNFEGAGNEFGSAAFTINKLLDQTDDPKIATQLRRQKIDVSVSSANNFNEAATHSNDGKKRKKFLSKAYSSLWSAANAAREAVVAEPNVNNLDLKLLSHNYFLQAGRLAAQVESWEDAVKLYSFASKMASKISRAQSDTRIKNKWSTTSFDEQMMAAETAENAGLSELAADQYSWAAKNVNEIIRTFDGTDVREWVDRRREANTKAGILWQSLGEMEKASLAFAHAGRNIYSENKFSSPTRRRY